jgi:hypothetical protein
MSLITHAEIDKALRKLSSDDEQKWECLCGSEDIDTLDTFLDRKEKRMREHCVCRQCKRVFDRVYEFSHNLENTETHDWRI